MQIHNPAIAMQCNAVKVRLLKGKIKLLVTTSLAVQF